MAKQIALTRRAALTTGLAAASGAMASRAWAAYPDHPIKLVVPFAAGGGVDVGGRLIANALTDELRIAIVVDNRGGAGGVTGMDAVAKSPADGYTLLTSHSGFTAMPGLYPKLPFDPVRDFAAIATATSSAYVLAVNSTRPFKSVADVVAHAKAHPGTLTYGSAGIGSSVHLAGEMMKSVAGIDILHVPYKGAGPALGDVVGGHIDMMFGPLVNIMPLDKSGEIRALAVTSPKRSIYAPGLPTMIEAGFADFVVDSWYGLAAPAGTPREVVDYLNAGLNKALLAPAMVAQLEKQGLEPVGGTPEAAAGLIRAEVVKWTRIIKAAGISAR